MKNSYKLTLIAAMFGLAACSDDEPAAVAEVHPGKVIWSKTCAVCHAQGLAGSPPIGNTKMWAPRIAKGMPTLYSHAKNGFSGETGEMPARGGNPALTDAEIELAVDYMVSQSKG
ncbi:cytochrome c5 family protein [Saccharobesus litoralis]|uniref:Cytochrome c5 family protein n=1 Tax=Saccharobesus litoralis TaxID=2172099 RepID=A0A2S0VRI9_9ALTE|nr:c-type cytochrome [Saccharobesus litoralis]AWB66814.1 cytochrome c5 family protein [Saccharobesus litoralis]